MNTQSAPRAARQSTWDLKLSDGTVVQWRGSTGVDAAERYVDCHRDAEVIASRPASAHGTIVVGTQEVVEPGHRDYGKRRAGDA